MSDTYRVLIKYTLSDRNEDYYPFVWLIDPPMQKRQGEYPRHVYSDYADSAGHPCLCLFYPGYREWNRNKLISATIVPWISAWLNTYEYWLVTGEWQYPESPHGGVK